MTRPFLTAAILIMALGLCVPAFASQHEDRQVSQVLMPDHRDCVFFNRVGVSEASPAIPGNPWIAIHRSHQGFREIFAFLLWAKGSGTPVAVTTTGSVSTGCNASENIVGLMQIYAWQ